MRDFLEFLRDNKWFALCLVVAVAFAVLRLGATATVCGGNLGCWLLLTR